MWSVDAKLPDTQPHHTSEGSRNKIRSTERPSVVCVFAVVNGELRLNSLPASAKKCECIMLGPFLLVPTLFGIWRIAVDFADARVWPRYNHPTSASLLVVRASKLRALATRKSHSETRYTAQGCALFRLKNHERVGRPLVVYVN